MDRAKEAVRRSLLAVGRTALGQRALRFYADNGLVGGRSESSLWNAAAAHRALVDLWDRRRHEHSPPTLDELTERPDGAGGPPLDRPDLDLSSLTADQRHWVEHGFVIKQGMIPSELLDAYWEVRSRYPAPHGWPCTNAYQHIPEALEVSVYRPVFELVESLIGEPAMLMLNLTGSVSTERNWHQDDYLNAAYTQGWYAAAWFAVDDVDPDSGPYQYVPGSHHWPVLRRDRVRMFLDPDERDSSDWTRLTERFLDDLLEAEIKERDAEVRSFVAHKGDVLLWHPRLLHRGSPPRVPGTERRALIAHYHGISHWSAPPRVAYHRDGGAYLVTDVPLVPVA